MPTPFARSLKFWREKRGLSQLQMSVKSGISTRHISYLENAKSEPSKELLRKIAETLDLTEEEEDALFVAAGFHRRSGGVVSDEIVLLLNNHDPFPAFVLADDYTIVAANLGFERLLQLLGTAWSIGDNFFELFTADVRSRIEDWSALERYFSTALNRSALVSDDSSLKHLVASFPNPPEENDDARFGVHIEDSILFFRPVSVRIETAQETPTDLRIDFLNPENDLCQQFFS